MKRKLSLAPLLLGTSMLLVGLGCTKDNGESQIPAPPANNVMPLTLNIVLTDAKTQQILNVAGTLTVATNNTANIYDQNGNKLTSISAAAGAPYICYSNPVAGSSTLNASFVANVPGYNTSNVSVPINTNDFSIDTNKTKTKIAYITLCSKDPNDLPNSVVTSTGTFTNNNNTPVIPNAQGAAGIPVEGGTSIPLGSATATIDKGTIFSDADGKPLGQNLNYQLTYFNNSTTQSMLCFPGGLSGINLLDGRSGAFISGGFASLEISDNTGKLATKLSNPAHITIMIPKGTFNPTTGAKIANNDQIPIWTYKPSLGQWDIQENPSKANKPSKVQFNGTVTEVGDSNAFAVKFDTDHLSYFNLDWGFWGQGSNIQATNIPFQIIGAKGLPIYFIFELPGRGFTHEWYLDAGEADPYSGTIFSAPMANQPINVYAWIDRRDNLDSNPEVPNGSPTANFLTKWTYKNYSDMIASGTNGVVPFNFTGDAATKINNLVNNSTSVDVMVYYTCSENHNIRTPEGNITVKAERLNNGGVVPGSAVWGNTDKTGKVTLPALRTGNDYRFTAFYPGKTSSPQVITVTSSTSVTLEFFVPCTSGATGSTGAL